MSRQLNAVVAAVQMSRDPLPPCERSVSSPTLISPGTIKGRNEVDPAAGGRVDLLHLGDLRIRQGLARFNLCFDSRDLCVADGSLSRRHHSEKQQDRR